MAAKEKSNSDSAFAEKGLGETVRDLIAEMQELYLCDQIPWVVGYSGGKDSSAVLQLVWLAVSKLSEDQRTKPIHVISTDTLVEQPIVSAWVDRSHEKMREEAAKQNIPLTPHKLTPDVKDTFWVNLIGKGYPKPSTQFRWCTSRMKINPSNTFIRNVVRENGEALLVLGTRKAESQRRAITMEKHEKHRYRQRISPNAGLPNSNVYSPIEDWTNDDVWLFLMQVKNPWRFTNKSLLGMYQGASEDNECPLVVDTSTPSCGSSRFGCWTCTVVDKDRSMEAMIKNDDEKLWMAPLLQLRNLMAVIPEAVGLGEREKIGKGEDDELAVEDIKRIERNRRDFRRIDGRVQLFKGTTIPGPYRKVWRERWLREVLEAQQSIRENGPKEFSKIELISIKEVQEIRRIWMYEKREFDDSLPELYESVTGESLPVVESDDQLLGSEDWQLLNEICGDDPIFFQLQTDLLDVEREFRGMTRRAGIYDAIENRLKAAQFKDEDEAYETRNSEKERREELLVQIQVDPQIQKVHGPHDDPVAQKSLFGKDSSKSKVSKKQ